MLQMGIQPEKREQERSDMGESVFPETDPISLFLGLLIYLLLHIGMNTESRGGLGVGVGRWMPAIAVRETARGSCLRTCTKTSSRVSPQMRLDSRNLYRR